MPETLTGILERVIFFNEETDYFVGEVAVEDKKEVVTIQGKMAGPLCGETLELHGGWTTSKYGHQFKFEHYKQLLPSSIYGIKKFLSSGIVKGVGEKLADKIVAKFGVDVFRVLDQDSGRLREIRGLGTDRAKALKAAWTEHQVLRESSIYLHSLGLGSSMCARLIKRFGSAVKRMIEENPYALIGEVDRLGFKTIDQVAKNAGVSTHSKERMKAGLEFACTQAEDDGHTALERGTLMQAASKLLEVEFSHLEHPLIEMIEAGTLEVIKIAEKAATESTLPPPQETETKPPEKSPKKTSAPQSAEEAADAMIDETIDEIIDGDFSASPTDRDEKTPENLLQTPKLARHEKLIAKHLMRIKKSGSALPSIDYPKALEWAQKRSKIVLTEEQGAAVVEAIKEKVYILTGGPGTGKTTVLKTLIEILRAKNVIFQLASPTGRAAQRMTETTGVQAQTIHRLLKYDPSSGSWSHNEKEPLVCDFLIVDETSMIDTPLMSALVRAIPDRAHLLLVGDADQLPSVGPGEILHDLINSKKFEVARLKRIFRQNEGLLLSTAHALLHGNRLPPMFKKNVEDFDPSLDLNAFAASTPEEAVEKIVALCQRVPRVMGIDPLSDVQVLVPMHRGEAGTINLNIKLQEALNPKKPGMTLGATRVTIGDKLLQTRNNYDKGLFNGDIGRVESFNAMEGTLSANFNNTRVTLGRQELSDTTLAYAISVHKSQGSEYPCVIVPLVKAHFAMLTRNLLYTAITRGKRQVIVVGDAAAWKMAAARVQTNTRTTGLGHYLAAH